MQRATVIRHIDNLEAELGNKLFQRHGRGYTPTDIGKDLLHVVGSADAEFCQLKARAKERDELHGEFIVTSLEFIAPFLLPVLDIFQQQYSQLEVRYLVLEELVKLEYGQAHIAIRSGGKPNHPDYVVKPFATTTINLFAHRDYLAKHGMPQSTDDFAQHQFVLVDKISGFIRSPFNQWLDERVPADNIALKSNNNRIRDQAILSGMGIGGMFDHVAANHSELVTIPVAITAREGYSGHNWLVTHGDLHRSEKVQRFLRLLAEHIDMP